MAKSFYTDENKNKDPNKALAESGSQQENKQKPRRGRNKTPETISNILDVKPSEQIPIDPVLVPESIPAEQEPQPQPPKRKPGRPTTKDVKNNCRNINVALPVTLLDKWDAVKAIHGGNLTSYITGLIQKDMDSNFDKYINIINTLNNI